MREEALPLLLEAVTTGDFEAGAFVVDEGVKGKLYTGVTRAEAEEPLSSVQLFALA